MQTTLVWKHIFLSAYMLSPTKIHAGIKKLQEHSGRKYFQNVATESIEISITYLLTNEESKIGLETIDLETFFALFFNFS